METTNIALSTRKGIPQFADADLRLISHMKRRIINKEPTFLSSVNPIFRETAQVAFMLSSLIHGIKIKPDAPYRSFFCNSHLEAIHGAIKIARHFVYNKKEEDSSGQVYCYDPDRYYVQYFNPMQSEEEELIPGIAFSEKRDLEHWIKKDGNCVALIVSPTYFEQVEQELSVLKKRCEEQEVLLILDLSRSNLELIRKWTAKGYLSHGDIICWGESLANNQFPFGAFSTRHEVYSPWNSLKNCLLHSSTFGGNNMALSFVKGILIEQFPFFESDPAFSQVIKKVEESAAYKVKVYKNYVNAYSEILYRSAKLDANVARAYGAKLFVENKQGQLLEKLDCVGGSGCSARGHNPQDIVPEVLERHRPNIDYWSKLVKQLQQITGLDRLMPGISGASVVEKAMCMALLAQHPSKKRIIVFNGNYAGKTLVAINGTDGDHSYFAPLYAHVEVCNPYLPNSRALVLKALKKGDVALIWFENVQGGSLLSIPPDIISLIKKYQPIYNFYVGIDEILNGVYRTGEFVSFANQDIQPNLITFSKALSDMVHPMAVAIMSEEVYQIGLNILIRKAHKFSR
ncbi:MAG: aminotransferase class III-fold pyridoxal phosphate-dependent enzyme, partial [Bacteroidota bacterium]